MESGSNSWEHGDNGVESSRRQREDDTGRYPSRPDTPIPSLQDPMIYPLPPEPEGSPNNVLGDRTPAEILRDTPETRAFINEINRYTTLRPFLIIMLLKVLLDSTMVSDKPSVFFNFLISMDTFIMKV